MRRELVSRLSQIRILDKYTKEDYKKMIFAKNGIINRFKYSLNRDGIALEIDDEIVDYMVNAVFSEELGARNINNKFMEILDDSFCYEAFISGCSKVILHKGIIKGEKPLMIKNEAETKVVDKGVIYGREKKRSKRFVS